MERFESLINNLKNKYQKGSDKAELMELVEQMRHELATNDPMPDHTSAPVAVWLPAGYKTPSTPEKKENLQLEPRVGDVQSDNATGFHKTGPTQNIQLEVGTHNQREINTVSSELAASTQFAISHMVPKPPSVIVQETDFELPALVEDEIASFLKKTEIQEPTLITPPLVQEMISSNGEDREEIKSTPVIEWSIEVPEDVLLKEIEEQKTKIYIPPGFLGSEKSPVAETTKTKELHEILANRIVASPEPSKNQSKVLADALASSKILDLRKAFGINDRFRFIKSLFRGDETLFERSIKTINNFNILAEAEYWIQRELVIKLGWNEEDELVQEFYRLVSRRFL